MSSVSEIMLSKLDSVMSEDNVELEIVELDDVELDIVELVLILSYSSELTISSSRSISTSEGQSCFFKIFCQQKIFGHPPIDWLYVSQFIYKFTNFKFYQK